MGKWLTVALSALLIACHPQGQASSGLSDEQRQQQQTFLKESIASTPYSAVVQLVDVEVQPVSDDPTMQWHIFSADVLEVLRGQHTPAIRYAIAV